MIAIDSLRRRMFFGVPNGFGGISGAGDDALPAGFCSAGSMSDMAALPL